MPKSIQIFLGLLFICSLSGAGGYFTGAANQKAKCTAAAVGVQKEINKEQAKGHKEIEALALDHARKRLQRAVTTKEKVRAIRNHPGNDCLNSDLPAGM